MANKDSEEKVMQEEAAQEEPAEATTIDPVEEFVEKQPSKAPIVETHAGIFNPHRVRFMVYGDSGVGKTVFASSWPDPIFLDLDQGMASITKSVARIAIDSWQSLQAAYVYLAYSDHKYRTVVVDSLNEGQWQAMQHVVSAFPSIRRSYDNLPSMSDYGKALDDFDKFIRYMRSLPLNVVFIAQLAKREDPEEMAMPQFTGKATAQNIARMMDVIGFLYKAESTESVKPRVMTFDDSRFLAKDRSGNLPPALENPTYAKLYEYWDPANKK